LWSWRQENIPMNNKRQTEGTQDISKQSTSVMLNDNVFWESPEEILLIAGDRSLKSALNRIRKNTVDWVVIVHTLVGSTDVYYHAFRSSELEWLAAQHPERKHWPIEQALDLQVRMSSSTSRSGRTLSVSQGQRSLAAARIVDFDSAGRIAAIGEWEDKIAIPHELKAFQQGEDARGIDIIGELGPTRGGHPTGGPTSEPPAEIEITLSSETKSEIRIGATELVDFRIELSSESVPLALLTLGRAKPNVPVVVSLSSENDAIEVVGSDSYTVDTPETGRPQIGFFRVKGMRQGVVRLAVAFRQGGSELGTIGFAVEVVEGGIRSKRAQGRMVSAPRDFRDDDKLALIVEQRFDGGEVFYQYILHSESLGLPYKKLRSKPLLDCGGGPAATTLKFVERIYGRVTKELKSRDDLKALQRETRALGASLCQELLDPEVAKVLWPLRNRIKTIQVVSWEPYIPWELVRLTDPDSGNIDDRYLAEYGLIRTLSDEMPPRSLPMTRWGYLGATFPMGTFPPIGAELDFFTGQSAESLRGHGIKPAAISATRDAFYNALANDEFDVLHLSCHAESQHQSIERARLIIGDETAPADGQPRLVEVDTITVQAEARLKTRRPLVFLNACETGRMGAVLTAWGGWPNVFLRAGAGAFVGSAWAVRDKPAAVFSTVFYNALLRNQTLAEAASAARTSAKKLGDASWLAFKVYGHPRARRESA
jgi:hypothetical protein